MRACALLLLVCFALGACAKRQSEDDCACSERIVDPVLLAFLSQARSAHHKADQQEAAGDKAGALRSLEQLVSSPRPPGSPPEVDEVLADTQARIADLLSQSGRFDPAEVAIESGLEHAKTTTYFRGHLFEVRGLVEERREKALRANRRGQEADEARRRSLDAYEEAMKVQAAVIAASAPGAPSATPAGGTHP